MRWLFIPVIALPLVMTGVAGAPSARAQDAALVQTCESDSVHLLERIRTCTAVIHGSLSKRVQAGAYQNRAFAYAQRGDKHRAIADLTEAIQLDVWAADGPAAARVYGNRALVLNASNEFDRAIADANAALRLDPGYATGFSARGEAFRAKAEVIGRQQNAPYNEALDRAIADYTEAIRLEPTQPVFYLGRGVAFADKGDFERGITDLTAAIGLAPRDPFFYRQRGIVFGRKGDYDRSSADRVEAARLTQERRAAPDPFEQCESESDPNMKLIVCSLVIEFDASISLRAAAYTHRGNVLGENGEPKRAIANFTEAIRLDPFHVPAYNGRGRTWLELGDHDRALADANEAIRLEPKISDGYFLRMLIFAEKGDKARADADDAEYKRLDGK